MGDAFCDTVLQDVELYTGYRSLNEHTAEVEAISSELDVDPSAVNIGRDSSDLTECRALEDPRAGIIDATAGLLVANSDYDRALQEAHSVNSRGHHGKLPWEGGIFQSIFDTNSPVVNPLSLSMFPPDAPQVTTSATSSIDGPIGAMSSVVKRPYCDAIYMHTVKSKKDLDHCAAMDKLWLSALQKWETVLACAGYAGIVGQEVKLALESEGDALAVIRNVLGAKSPRTAMKRASTMLNLFSWLDKSNICLWPLATEHITIYLDECAERGSGSTKGKTLFEALRFCLYVMKLSHLTDIVDNPILTGRVARMDALRNVVRQCRPLTCDEVLKLEQFMDGEHDIWDKYIVGCILFALYSRSRWSDLAFLQTFQLDVADTALGPYGFVEGTTLHHKTGAAAIKKSHEMPLVAPIAGISTKSMWALQWFDTLRELEFDFTPPVGAICRGSHKW